MMLVAWKWLSATTTTFGLGCYPLQHILLCESAFHLGPAVVVIEDDRLIEAHVVQMMMELHLRSRIGIETRSIHAVIRLSYPFDDSSVV